MNSKVLAAVAVVVIVVAAAAAYFVWQGGGDDEVPDTVKLELKDGYVAGDYYVMEEVWNSPTGETETNTYKYTFLRTENGTDKASMSTGTETIEISMSSGFLSNLIPPADDLASFSKVASEVLDTSFGNVMCDVMEGSIEGVNTKVWICPDNGVAFRIEVSTDATQGTYSASRELVDTNLFLVPDTPSEGDDAKYKDALRSDLSVRVGDFYEYTTTFGDVTFTTSQEVLSIDGETLTVAWEGDGGSMTITESEDEFLVGMMPLAYIAGAEEAGTETISTVAGDVVCTIYEVTEESQGTMKMWVSGSTHVMYYAEMSYNGQTMTYTLVGNSFLQEA